MIAYLDNNVLVDIEQGKKTVEEVINNVDKSIHSIFYSAAHLEEAEEMNNTDSETKNQRIQRRLETIESVTSNNYIYQNLQNEISFLIERPKVVLETLREVSGTDKLIKSFISLYTPKNKNQFRDLLGIDIKRINNYTPNEVVNHFNTKMSNYGAGLSFLEVIESAVGYHPNGATFGNSERMASMFEILDLLGYWKDKETGTSNYARLWDSNHAFHASYCNYFISDDKRTRYKAKVVYQLMEISTIIVSSNGQID